MIKRLGDRVIEFLSFVLAMIAGTLIAAAVTVWHFVPKWRREEQEKTDRRIAAMRDAIRKAQEERTAKVDQAVAVVKEQAEADKKKDTVDLANSLIAEFKKE